MAKQHRISWQRDFFDHRLRSWESAVEKTQYVLMNPVRVGLVNEAEDWPFRYQNW
jgi:putative transposase